MFKRSLFASALFLAASQVSALQITADGDLKDWLANAPKGKSSDWTPKPDAGIKWMEEDQTGGAGRYLEPGYGGQAYDAEAIYVHRSATHIDIAIVTGLSPAVGNKYPAGDIAIDFGLDGKFDIGVVTLADGVGLGGTSGEVYAVGEWNHGLWVDDKVAGNAINDFKKAHPTTIKSAAGNVLGSAAFSYSKFKFNGEDDLPLGKFKKDKHYVIEAAIPLELLTGLGFDANGSFLVHWTMACANDFVQVDPPGVPVPAPLGLLLLGVLPLLRSKGTRA